MDFKFPETGKVVFPKNGIGAELLNRQTLVDKLIKLALEGDFQHFYFRGPRGSGKTVLLQLIGRQLQNLGHRVIFIAHARSLDKIGPEPFEELERSIRPGGKVFVLVDEVQTNKNSDVWNTLLKKPDNQSLIFTIGAGIPTLSGDSPAFDKKLPHSDILLGDDDIDEVAKFCQKISGIKDSGSIKRILQWLLEFTGGHCFPFLKLSHFVFSNPQNRDRILAGTMDTFLSSQEFSTSKTMVDIQSRCYDIGKEVLDAAHGIFNFENVILNQQYLDKLGYWSNSREYFISNLFVTILFGCRKRIVIPEIDWKDREGAFESVLKFSLDQMREDHFIEPDMKTPSYEDAIGMRFGWILSGIEGLYVSPQTQVVSESRSGTKKPTIDFYLNGKLDTYLEFVRNGSLLKLHCDKSKDGLFKSKRLNYATWI